MSSYLKTDIIECNSDFGVGTSGDFTNTTAPQVIPKGSQISIDGSIVQQISAGTDNIIELSNRNGLNVDYVSSYNAIRVIYWISNNGNNGSTLPLVCVGEGAKDNNGAIITPAFFPNNIDMPNSPIISTDNYCYAIPIKSTIQELPAIPSSVEGLYGLTCMEQNQNNTIPPNPAVGTPLGKDYSMYDASTGNYWLMSSVQMDLVKKFVLQTAPIPEANRKIIGTDEEFAPQKGSFQSRLMGVGGIFPALRKNAPNSEKYYLLNIGFVGPTNQRDTEFFDNAPRYYFKDVILNLQDTLLETPDEIAFKINTALQDSFINQQANTQDVRTEQYPRTINVGIYGQDNLGDYKANSLRRQINISSKTLINIDANFCGGAGDALNGRNPYDTIFVREPDRWISGMKLLYANYNNTFGGALDYPPGDVNGFRYGYWTKENLGTAIGNFNPTDDAALYRNYQTVNADSEVILQNIVATQNACIVSNVKGTNGTLNMPSGTSLFMKNWVSTSPGLAPGDYLGDANVNFFLDTGAGGESQQPTIFNTGTQSQLTFFATNMGIAAGNYVWVTNTGDIRDVVGVVYTNGAGFDIRLGIARFGIGSDGRNSLLVYKANRVALEGFTIAFPIQLDLEIPFDQQTMVQNKVIGGNNFNFFEVRVRNREIDKDLRTFDYPVSDHTLNFERLDIPAVAFGQTINGLPYVPLEHSQGGGPLMNDIVTPPYVSEWLCLNDGFIVPTNMYLTISIERIRQFFRANEVYDGPETEKEKIEADTFNWYVDLDVGWADDFNNALSNYLSGDYFHNLSFTGVRPYNITGEESNWSWYGNWYPNIRSNDLFRNPDNQSAPTNETDFNYICPNVIYPCSRYSKNGIISPNGILAGYNPKDYIGGENKLRVHSRWFDELKNTNYIKRDNRELFDDILVQQGEPMMLHPTIRFNLATRYMDLIKEANLALIGCNFYTGNGGGWDQNVSPLVGFVNWGRTFGGHGRREGSFYVDETQQTPDNYKGCWRIGTGTPIGFAPESTTNPILAPLNNTVSNPPPDSLPSGGAGGFDGKSFMFNRPKTELNATQGGSIKQVQGPNIFSMFENDSVNFIQVGAIDPQLQFNNGRMEFTQFHTPRRLNALDDEAIGNEGNIVAGFNVNTMNFPSLDFNLNTLYVETLIQGQFLPTPEIKRINTGIDDSVSGIGILKIFVRNELANANEFHEFNPNYLECKFVNGVATNFKGCLLNRLGFKLEQFKPLFGRTYNRFAPNTFGRNNLDAGLRYSGSKYFTTNSQINQSSSQALSLFGPNYHYQTTPLNIEGAQNFNLGYTNFVPFFLSTESASLRAENLPSKLQNAYYMIATDLPVSGYRSNNNHMNIIGTFYLQYKGGNFFFSYPVSYSKTITQDYPLSSIRTQILDQSGRVAENLGDHTIVFYKIQTPSQLTTMTPQEVQDFINVGRKPPNSRFGTAIPLNFNGRLNKYNENVATRQMEERPPTPEGIVNDEDMMPIEEFEPFEPPIPRPPPAVITVGPPMDAGGMIPNYEFVPPPPSPTAREPVSQEASAIVDAIIRNPNGPYVNIEDLPFGLDQQILDIILNDRDDLDLDESPDFAGTGAFYAVVNGYTANQRFQFIQDNPELFNPQPPPVESTEGIDASGIQVLDFQASQQLPTGLLRAESPTDPFQLETFGPSAVIEDLDIETGGEMGSGLPDAVVEQFALRGKYDPTEEQVAAAEGVMTQEQAEAQFSNVFAPPTPPPQEQKEPESKEERKEEETKE